MICSAMVSHQRQNAKLIRQVPLIGCPSTSPDEENILERKMEMDGCRESGIRKARQYLPLSVLGSDIRPNESSRLANISDAIIIRRD